MIFEKGFIEEVVILKSCECFCDALSKTLLLVCTLIIKVVHEAFPGRSSRRCEDRELITLIQCASDLHRHVCMCLKCE